MKIYWALFLYGILFYSCIDTPSIFHSDKVQKVESEDFILNEKVLRKSLEQAKKEGFVHSHDLLVVSTLTYLKTVYANEGASIMGDMEEPTDEPPKTKEKPIIEEILSTLDKRFTRMEINLMRVFLEELLAATSLRDATFAIKDFQRTLEVLQLTIEERERLFSVHAHVKVLSEMVQEEFTLTQN